MFNSIVKLIDKNNFNFNLKYLKPFFKDLVIDCNDKILYNLEPFRARKILYIKYKHDKFYLDKGKKTFTQNVADIRRKKRKFTIFSPNKKELKILISFLKEFLKHIDKEITIKDSVLEITVHFVKILANKKGQTNSPEGIHRDGFDILMPCFVIERKNIKGGYSRFFINKKCVFKKQIKEGQGIYIYENLHKNVFHDVTPIYSTGKISFRTIIGIDINIK
jgi:hypothetical protein